MDISKFKRKQIVLKGRRFYKVREVFPCNLQKKCAYKNCSAQYIKLENDHSVFCSALFRAVTKAERFLYEMGIRVLPRK